MYSCPADDIHSLYVDNELPLSYAKQYEAHIASCEECSKKLEKLRSMKDFFKADSEKIDLSSADLDKSYERLMTKMKYSKNTRFERQMPGQKIFVGIAAAAAVLAFAIIPASIFSGGGKTSSVQVANLVPVERPQKANLSNKNIIINGNINENLPRTVSTGRLVNTSLADVDVFRPDFNGNSSFSIKISVPALEDNEEKVLEVKLPGSEEEISGLLK